MPVDVSGGPHLPSRRVGGRPPGVHGAGEVATVRRVLGDADQVGEQVADAPVRAGRHDRLQRLVVETFDERGDRVHALHVRPGGTPPRQPVRRQDFGGPVPLGEQVEELLAGGGVLGQALVDRGGPGSREAGGLEGEVVVTGGPFVAPRLVVGEVVATAQGVPDVPAVSQRVADPVRGHRMLEQSGVADQRPTRSGCGADEAPQHGLRDRDHRGDLLSLLEQPRIQSRGEPPQRRQVLLLPPGRRAAGQVGGSVDRQQVHAVLARRRHQRERFVDVDLAPRRVGQPLPVREQHRHLTAPVLGRGQLEPVGDGRGATVGADHPASRQSFAAAQHDAADWVVVGAGADQLLDLCAQPQLGTGCRCRVDQNRIQAHPADGAGAVVATDRSECAGDGVPEHPPAVADRPQSMSRTQTIPGAQPVEQLQRIREQLMRRYGVAGKGVAVHEQHPSTGAGQDRGHGRPGASCADDDRVVLLVPGLRLHGDQRARPLWKPRGSVVEVRSRQRSAAPTVA